MMNKVKITTIIIEDEIESQKYLTSIISKEFTIIEIVDYARNIKDAIKLINLKKPELIFMDIELTDGNCFEIFKKINFHEFEVVFVTAHDNYIKKAIDHYAFSFIVKPINTKKIKEVINRYVKLRERLFSIQKYQLLVNFIQRQDSKILLNIGREYISIKINDIIKCEADGNYTIFHLNNKKKYMVSKSLKYYESLFLDKGFFRASRSILINIDCIASIYKKESIILNNNDKINISIRNKSKLINLINLIS